MRYSFRKLREASTDVEVRCDACNGTGFQPVTKPAQPGRRLFPAKCVKCGGKGRLRIA
jgi:DnaJ-class molecular chaperone